MKLKRILSLALALVMSFALAVPAFADEPDDDNEGIMLLAQLYSDNSISANSGTYRPHFTTTPNDGRYLRIWFHNQGAETVMVTLVDYNTKEALKSQAFAPGVSNVAFVYIIPTPDKACSYELHFESIGSSGARVIGQAAAAQYVYYPQN